MGAIKGFGPGTIVVPPMSPQRHISPRKGGMSPCVVGVDGEHATQAAPALKKVCPFEGRMVGSQSVGGPQVVFIGLPARRYRRKDTLGFGLVHVDGEHRHDRARDLVLDSKDVLKPA